MFTGSRIFPPEPRTTGQRGEGGVRVGNLYQAASRRVQRHHDEEQHRLAGVVDLLPARDLSNLGRPIASITTTLASPRTEHGMTSSPSVATDQSLITIERVRQHVGRGTKACSSRTSAMCIGAELV